MKTKTSLLNQTLLLFCIIFTVVTILSSAIHLIIAEPMESHVHIIDRASLTLLGSLVLVTMLRVDFGHPLLNFIVPYAIFIILAMVYVWISGFFMELHPHAYRDVFINDTIAYIIVYAGIKIYKSKNA